MDPTSVAPPAESILAFSGRMGDLDYRPVRVVPRSCTIADASRYFAASDVEYLVVHDHRIPIGLVHKFDLLRQNMTRTLPQQDPISTVMDSHVVTVQDDEPVLESLMFMIKHDVKLLIVMRGKEVMGAVSQHDWLRLQTQYPTVLLHDIAQAADIEALAALRASANEVIWKNFETDADVEALTRIVTVVNDTTTRKVISLALDELARQGSGPPPVAFAWLSMGSAGRSAQTVFTDQDNGLLFDAVAAERAGAARDWFALLAERVVAGLEACGFPRCAGNAMATNPDLLGSLDDWTGLFERIISGSDDKDLFEASIYFDFRTIFGKTSLADALRNNLLDAVRRRPYFLRHLVEVAIQGSAPPINTLRWRLYVATGIAAPPFDLKKNALMPLDACMRVLALQGGAPGVATLDRIQQCLERGALPKSLGDDLRKAFDFLLRLRFSLEFSAASHPKDERLLVRIARLLPAQARYLEDALAAVAELREFTYQHVIGHPIPWSFR